MSSLVARGVGIGRGERIGLKAGVRQIETGVENADLHVGAGVVDAADRFPGFRCMDEANRAIELRGISYTGQTRRTPGIGRERRLASRGADDQRIHDDFGKILDLDAAAEPG